MTTGGSTRETIAVAEAAGAQRASARRRSSIAAATRAASICRCRRCVRMDVPTYPARVVPAVRARAAGGEAGIRAQQGKGQTACWHWMQDHQARRAYDGSDYRRLAAAGQGVSIQGLIEEALATIDGAPVTLHGAGRTDAGVHALGQVASVATDARRSRTGSSLRALNAHLPDAIRVTAADDGSPTTFHARFSAIGEDLPVPDLERPTCSPVRSAQYAWHVREPLDVALMQQASQAIPGRHDFAAFRSARQSEVDDHGPRDSLSVDVAHGATRHDRWSFEIDRQRAFCATWSAAIVGTARGGRARAAAGRAILRGLLAARIARRPGRTAPARGLFLVEGGLLSARGLVHDGRFSPMSPEELLASVTARIARRSAGAPGQLRPAARARRHHHGRQRPLGGAAPPAARRRAPRRHRLGARRRRDARRGSASRC